MKRAAVPPLLDVEMEPGQAVKVALELIHPFFQPAVLPPDLQEALHVFGGAFSWLGSAAQVLLDLSLGESCGRTSPTH